MDTAPAAFTTSQFDAHLSDVVASPADDGTVALVVARPAVGERRIMDSARLEVGRGLVGDNYVERGSKATADGAAHPLAELAVMNARVLAAVAGPDHDRWALAGDQLILDLDLSAAQPAIEVT